MDESLLFGTISTRLGAPSRFEGRVKPPFVNKRGWEKQRGETDRQTSTSFSFGGKVAAYSVCRSHGCVRWSTHGRPKPAQRPCRRFHHLDSSSSSSSPPGYLASSQGDYQNLRQVSTSEKASLKHASLLFGARVCGLGVRVLPNAHTHFRN